MIAGSRNVNRDTVPIMAAVGEMMISRAGVRANDVGTLAYMNQGGRVVPASGGGGGGEGSIYITLNFNGSGGVPNPEEIKAAARQGVLEGMRDRPGYRNEMRRYVGGGQ
jgi:hypothetical protein